MKKYKGISKDEFPDWVGWKHISLYESITDDFDNDVSLQRAVKFHYFKQELKVIFFNLSFYILPTIIYQVMK